MIRRKIALWEVSKQLRKQVLGFIGEHLYYCIWNWIKAFPEEFLELYKSNGRLSGNPDILFDIFNDIADSTKKKNLFWRSETMLLLVCPDIISQIVKGSGKNISKKSSFLEGLKKALKSRQLAEVAASSYLDVCKASTYVSSCEHSPLKFLVPDIENELKVAHQVPTT